MDSEDSAKGEVQITSESLVGQWVNRRSARLGTQLAAMQRNLRPEQVFVENEVLIGSDDTDTLDYLVERHAAEIIPPPPVPPQPEGMDPQRARSTEGMPTVTRARFQGEDVSLEALETIAEQQPERTFQVTSRAGAGTLALATGLALDGRRVLPNLVGETAALPLSASTEGPRSDGTSDAYQWPEYTGPSRVARAWQLMEAYSQVRSIELPIFLGILDTGFNLDNAGNPRGPNPDVTQFIQWNLANYPDSEGGPADGPNNEPGKEWHGNTVLSAAAAPINNGAGAAGAGGVASAQSSQQIVIPVLFKTFRTISQIFRCLQLSVAWGIDVVNISFLIKFPKILLPVSAEWDDVFQFAADQGVVVVAGAGNDNEALPDAVVFPATRTPGVITVGALDTGSGTLAAGFSNYGSSVDIWAPGTNVHVMPDSDPGNSSGSQKSGTSVAAPIVAGTAVLMKSVNPALKSSDIKSILRETGHTGSPDPKVTVSLNAQAALLRVMGDRLPDGTIEEPNNTPQTARPLFPGPDGTLAPVGDTTLSTRNDQDWYSFQTDDYSRLLVTLDYVPELSSMEVELVPDDPQSRAVSEQQSSGPPGKRRLEVEQLAPGSYRLLVTGSHPNIYELRASLTPNPLKPDIFEANNTLESATQFKMKKDNPLLDTLFKRFHPGIYEANLHLASDVDYFHIEDINPLPLVNTTFSITDTDKPLDAVLYGVDRVVKEEFHGVRALKFKLSAPECWIQISSTTANRYTLRLHDELDKDMIPGPLEEEDINPIPDWWPDPPFVLREWERFLQVEITDELKQVGKLRLTGTPGLTLELLSTTGSTLASGAKVENHPVNAVEMDLSAVETGTYIVRVGRDLEPGARLNPMLSKSVANFILSPGW